MRIQKLRIENFKRFEQLEIELYPFDCVVGANNSGKTTVLQALALFDFCLHACLTRKNGDYELKPRSIAPEEFSILVVAQVTDLWTNRRTQTRKGHIKIKVEITFTNDRLVSATVDLNYNRFSVAIITDEDPEWLAELAKIKFAYLPVFSSFLPQEERRNRIAIEDELGRGRVNYVIRNLLFNLKERGLEEEFTRLLQNAFPSLERFIIEYDDERDRYINVKYKEKLGGTKDLDLFSAGSGFQQFVYLFGFILLQQPTMVLLDEPDVHLHGHLQQTLLQELGALVDGGMQILLATHSSDLIKQIPSENILSLSDGNMMRLTVAEEIYDVLNNLGSLDNTQLPALKTYQRVVVVENKDDWKFLERFCEAILGEAAWQQVKGRLAICYAKGNPYQQQDMDKLRDMIQQIIGMSQPLHMMVIADRDFSPNVDILYQELNKPYLTWHIWERTEIENYLLVASAIQKTASQGVLNPLDGMLIEQKIEELAQVQKNTVNDRLVGAFSTYSSHARKGWDMTTISRMAREFLETQWDTNKLVWVDAKEDILPPLKTWLQEQGLKSFSNLSLAKNISSQDLPEEIHQLAADLANFAAI